MNTKRSKAFFDNFVLLCQQLDQTQSHKALANYLGTFFSTFDIDNIVASVYLLQGLFQPLFIPVQLGISDAIMQKILSMVHATSVEEVKKLFHAMGDLGTVSESYTLKTINTPKATHNTKKNIVEIRELFLTCTKIQGEGSQEHKQHFLAQLLCTLDPLARKYIVRLALGKLRLGVSDAMVIKGLVVACHLTKEQEEIVTRAHAIYSDLGMITRVLLESGVTALEPYMVPKISIPILPASAERLSRASDIITKLGSPCIAQPKYDGLRIQIHIKVIKQDNKIDNKADYELYFFSRNLLPTTHMFPELHAPLKNMCIAHNISSAILDGEIISYDSKNNRDQNFQETASRRRIHDIGEQTGANPIRLVLFDCMYFNNISYLERPYHERLALLDVFTTAPISKIESCLITTEKQLSDYFEKHVHDGYEGIIIKKWDAPYYPGKRTYAWIKWKRIQKTATADTLDVVILGYYSGHGKRSELGIGALLVAVYSQEHACFQTIAKVGTGMNEETWAALKQQCDQERAKTVPISVMCNKSLYPDVWCNPSIVVSVQADELSKSSVHTAGISLRFPRLVAIRNDKNVSQITTVAELESMNQKNKIFS